VIGEYSGHVAVVMPTSAVTRQSAVREPGRRGTWPDDFSTSGLWSQPNRKSSQPEMANGGGHLELGQLCWLICVVSAQLVMSTRL